jgi:hypothetical protein
LDVPGAGLFSTRFARKLDEMLIDTNPSRKKEISCLPGPALKGDSYRFLRPEPGSSIHAKAKISLTRLKNARGTKPPWQKTVERSPKSVIGSAYTRRDARRSVEVALILPRIAISF